MNGRKSIQDNDSVVRETLASLLLHGRVKLQLSQNALGEIVGVDGSTISQYETGLAWPSSVVLLRLAGCLDFDLTPLARLAATNTRGRPRKAVTTRES